MSYSLLNPKGGQSSQYHLIPNLSLTPTVEPMQGPHLNIGTYSTPSFDFAPSTESSFEMPTIHSHSSATGLYKGTVSAFVKTEVPDFKIAPELKTIGVAYSALKTAEKLVNNRLLA